MLIESPFLRDCVDQSVFWSTMNVLYKQTKLIENEAK